MAQKSEIVVVGSHAPGIFIRVDRVPQAGETVIGWDFDEPIDGGKGSNQAIAAARLGASVSFVGCVGNDRIGDTGETWMREAGVDTTWLMRGKGASGTGLIILDKSGVPAMVTSMGANAELTKEIAERSLEALKGARVMLTQFEIEPDVALHAARIARGLGMITIVNPAPAAGWIDGLEAASILTPNESEAKALLGLNPATEMDYYRLARELRTRSRAGVVIITAGEQGIIGSDLNGDWFVRAPVVDVVDTSGAGDVFCAALAVGLVDGQDVRAASAEACAIASLSVSKAGTIPAYPNRGEAASFLSVNRPEVLTARRS